MLFPGDFSRIKLSTSISIYHLIATHINPNDWSTASPDTRDLEARGSTNRKGRQRVILRLTRGRGRETRCETRSCLKVSAFWWWWGFHFCCHNDFICILLRAGVKEEGTLAAGSCSPVWTKTAPLSGSYPVLKLHFLPPCETRCCRTTPIASGLLSAPRRCPNFPFRSAFSACSSLRLLWTPRWMKTGLSVGRLFLCCSLKMPRSFLVKKVKLDDFSSTDLESSYSRSRTDLSLRIHEKGKWLKLVNCWNAPFCHTCTCSLYFEVGYTRRSCSVLTWTYHLCLC